MLNEAKKKERDNLKFKQGFGEKTGLSESIADIVICVQAFHWMNPEMAIKEVHRILKPNGIYDKDRFMSFILSHSTVQQLIKNNNINLEALDDDLEGIFQNRTLEAIFSYRMSIGIK